MNKFSCVDFISVNLKNILSEYPDDKISDIYIKFVTFMHDRKWIDPCYDPDIDNETLVKYFGEFAEVWYGIKPTEVCDD